MNYETWRISYQSSEQAARAAFKMYVESQQSKAQAVKDAIVAALRLYGNSDLNATEIDALADHYVDNVIIKGSDNYVESHEVYY